MQITEIENNKAHKDVSILHLDKLQLTLKLMPYSRFNNSLNPNEVGNNYTCGDFELKINNHYGSKSYYHCFDVLYQGIKIGNINTGNKFHKPLIQFDVDKQLLYSDSKNRWRAVVEKMMNELGMTFNNFKTIEIALDSTVDFLSRYRQLYYNSTKYPNCINPIYAQSRKVLTNELANGSSFTVQRGVKAHCTKVAIYNKTERMEKFIQDFFNANGFDGRNVYRCESRLHRNSIESFKRNRLKCIDLDTIADTSMLATIFFETAKPLLSFKDMASKWIDTNRNSKFEHRCPLDGIELTKSELISYVSSQPANIYKHDNEDVEIIKRQYKRYLDLGTIGYLEQMFQTIMLAKITAANFNLMKNRFDQNYQGDLSKARVDRMAYTETYVNSRLMKNVDEEIHFHLMNWQTQNKSITVNDVQSVHVGLAHNKTRPLTYYPPKNPLKAYSEKDLIHLLPQIVSLE